MEYIIEKKVSSLAQDVQRKRHQSRNNINRRNLNKNK